MAKVEHLLVVVDREQVAKRLWKGWVTRFMHWR